ncbi:MAG: PIG-L family deacetylase [Candidatus Didemnitutus sp.]|nr:PIG-L family deacetylase [Candidatus Didemnitutus sp.]
MKEFARLQLGRLLRRLLAANSRVLPSDSAPLLVLAPHADDETLGCGALLASRAARGTPTHVVFVSDSASADWAPGQTRPARAAHRRAEALAALGFLGLPPACADFLDAPDGDLDRLEADVRTRVLGALAEVLRRHRPARVLVPFLGGGSTEHDAVFWLAREACVLAGMSLQIWEYPVWAWWNPLRLRSQLLRRGENYRLATAPWLDAKRRAWQAHASQAAALPAALVAAALAEHEFYFNRTHLP